MISTCINPGSFKALMRQGTFLFCDLILCRCTLHVYEWVHHGVLSVCLGSCLRTTRWAGMVRVWTTSCPRNPVSQSPCLRSVRTAAGSAPTETSASSITRSGATCPTRWSMRSWRNRPNRKSRRRGKIAKPRMVRNLFVCLSLSLYLSLSLSLSLFLSLCISLFFSLSLFQDVLQ